MTIYTTKPGEKKDEWQGPEPQVVTDPLVPAEFKPEKKEKEEAILPAALVTVATRKRRNSCANVCVVLTALVVLAIGVVGGICLYKYLAHRTFRGWCGVKYYEFLDDDNVPNSSEEQGFGEGHLGHHGGRRRHKHTGHFEEKVEIDKVNGKYEKIEVPAFDEVNRAMVLHDFEKNLTAIVDRDDFRCFIMPLNRTVVKPPKDFWDMISKLGSGYYMPDVEVVRESYRVVQPSLRNLAPLGYYIWRECRHYETFSLKKVDATEPVAMVKRSIDGSSRTYALPGQTVMEVIKIKGM